MDMRNSVHNPNMPRRHGIRRDGTQPIGLFGVWDLFEVLARPPFMTTPLGTPHEPTILAFHFRQALKLLFYSLDQLQQKCTDFDRFLEDGALAGPNPGAIFDLQTEVNAFAQSVLTNLNIVLDDIARIIPFVLFVQPTKSQKANNGFLQFKKYRLAECPDTSIIPQLKTLFSELDRGPNWFKTSIEYGIGMRQRLNHYTDLIILSGSTPAGESKMQPRFELASVGTPESMFDFPVELKNVLHSLCHWLDKLDALLTQHLSARAKAESLDWKPRNECPGYSLPIVGSAMNRTLPEVDYLYIPICT